MSIPGEWSEANAVSLLHPTSKHYSNSCGYCAGDRGGKKRGGRSCTYGAMSVLLRAEDYQNMIDHGWRRCGDYTYKPVMHLTCCPQYTIRLRCDDFVPTKEQRKVRRRFEAMLAGESNSPPTPRSSLVIGDNRPSFVQHQTEASAMLTEAVAHLITTGILPPGEYKVPPLHRPPKKILRQHSCVEGTARIAGLTTLCSAVGSALHAQANKIDVKETTKTDRSAPLVAAAIEAFIAPRITGDTPLVRVEASRNGYINFLYRHDKGEEDEEDEGVNPPPGHGARSQARREPTEEEEEEEPPLKKRHAFEVKTVPAEFCTAAHDLYQKYQMTVHGDTKADCSPEQYRRFLCTSTFPPASSTLSGSTKTSPPWCGYGAFHQQYWLDGELIAVGVVDVLPQGLSSKYFFYDPERRDLELGKLGALLEIEWVVKHCPPENTMFKYYYLGFYVHNCPKMKYKAKYGPAELLDPVTYRYIPYAEAVKAIEAAGGGYATFDPWHGEQRSVGGARTRRDSSSSSSSSSSGSREESMDEEESDEDEQDELCAEQWIGCKDTTVLMKQPILLRGIRQGGSVNWATAHELLEMFNRPDLRDNGAYDRMRLKLEKKTAEFLSWTGKAGTNMVIAL